MKKLEKLIVEELGLEWNVDVDITPTYGQSNIPKEHSITQKKWNDSGSIFLNFQVSNSSQTTRQTWTPFPIRTDCVGQEETFCPSMLSETLQPGGEVIALVKPQFEADREQVGEKGVVKDPK